MPNVYPQLDPYGTPPPPKYPSQQGNHQQSNRISSSYMPQQASMYSYIPQTQPPTYQAPSQQLIKSNSVCMPQSGYKDTMNRPLSTVNPYLTPSVTTAPPYRPTPPSRPLNPFTSNQPLSSRTMLSPSPARPPPPVSPKTQSIVSSKFLGMENKSNEELLDILNNDELFSAYVISTNPVVMDAAKRLESLTGEAEKLINDNTLLYSKLQDNREALKREQMHFDQGVAKYMDLQLKLSSTYDLLNPQVILQKVNEELNAIDAKSETLCNDYIESINATSDAPINLAPKTAVKSLPDFIKEYTKLRTSYHQLSAKREVYSQTCSSAIEYPSTN